MKNWDNALNGAWNAWCKDNVGGNENGGKISAKHRILGWSGSRGENPLRDTRVVAMPRTEFSFQGPNGSSQTIIS